MKTSDFSKAAQMILDASVWSVPNPDAQPEIILKRWQVMQLPNGDRHFVGWNAGDREGRASTKIISFDPVKRRGKTVSGREYELDGQTGRDGDGMHTWSRWLKVNGTKEFVDVSSEYQDLINKANLSKDGL